MEICELKQRLDRETVISILSFIGYEIQRDHKFKLRPEEKTASASISPTARVVDFGSGFSGDIFDVLTTYHSMSLPEAIKYVADCVGVEL